MMTGTLTLPKNIDEGLSRTPFTGLTTRLARAGNAEWRGPRVPNALVGDARREESFGKCISQLDAYRRLPEDWDTYGGLPASDISLEFARGFLNELRWLPEVSAPRVSPISGGVYIEWKSGHANVYFEVDDDSILFVMQDGDCVVEEGEDPAFGIDRAVKLVQRFHRNPV